MTFWNLYQEMSIRSLRGQAAGQEAVADARHAQLTDATYQIEDRFDRLLLLTEAMWELLSTHLGFTEEHLAHKVAEIDQRDGHLDQRRTRPARRCHQCEAAVPRDRSTCMFCEAVVPGSTTFDQV
jgi:hypothetical protein